MRRILSVLGVLVCALALCVVSNGSASAFGGEVLECRVVAGSSVPAFTTGECLPAQPAFTYSISFEVFDGSGTYTHTWTIPSGAVDPGGCTSTDVGCAFDIRSRAADRDIDVSVQLQQGGQTETLTGDAFLPATCSEVGEPVDC